MVRAYELAETQTNFIGGRRRRVEPENGIRLSDGHGKNASERDVSMIDLRALGDVK
jgi:hypothetical protein